MPLCATLSPNRSYCRISPTQRHKLFMDVSNCVLHVVQTHRHIGLGGSANLSITQPTWQQPFAATLLCAYACRWRFPSSRETSLHLWSIHTEVSHCIYTWHTRIPSTLTKRSSLGYLWPWLCSWERILCGIEPQRQPNGCHVHPVPILDGDACLFGVHQTCTPCCHMYVGDNWYRQNGRYIMSALHHVAIRAPKFWHFFNHSHSP